MALSWWHRLLKAKFGPASRRRHGFRPHVEALEGREVPAAVFTVLNTNDAGAGSLRLAILQANATPNVGGPDQIRFNIGGPPSTEIFLSSALPDVTEAVVIDGTTQPGANGKPAVELNGTSVAGDGLVLRNHSGSMVKGLVINRFGGNGILISGGGGHLITNDFIGTATGGAGFLGNHIDGVHLANSSGNVISASVLSGNGDDGVEIDHGTGNRVEGNKIGTDIGGLTALGNFFGMFLQGASNNLVLNNVIAANSHVGVGIESGSNGNVLQGNLIGLGVDGSTALGHLFAGIALFNSSNNAIGGLAPGQRNVIADNGENGVLIGITSNGNVVQGNFIGTDATGTLDRGNTDNGVSIKNGASNNTVANNLISGNADAGVKVSDAGTSGNVVKGNLLGTDVSGTKALGNGFAGVRILDGASGNLVGGPTAADRNVISANGSDGVGIEEADGNTVQGNFIGTTANGLAALGNDTDGVFLREADDNVILGNVISGSVGEGLLMSGDQGVAPHRNVIRGNLIGVAADGTSALGNALEGILINLGAETLIEGNVIAHNGDDGVAIGGSTVSTGNTITGNRIFANAKRGIDLGATGPDTNDTLDADNGTNRLQNTPALTTAVSAAGQTVFTGTLHSTPNTTFRIELFANGVPDPSGFGEGETFLGSITVSTDANGNASFSFTANLGLPGSSVVTATATNLGTGDTSEFSAARAVQAFGGTVRGTQFLDRNGNGVRDPGEPGLSGVTVFADLNGNGRPDAGESSAVSAADGSFTLGIAQDGTFAVRQVVPPGFRQTTPDRVVGVAGGSTASGVNLGEQARDLVASLVAVGKKKKVLQVVVRFTDTGEVKTAFKSPFQKPAFKRIKVTTIAAKGDGVADTVVLSARRNGMKKVRLITV
jgi:parallel beta-helix repeat protein